MKVALLTGGKDAHYVRGLVRHLTARGVDVELAGGLEEMTMGSGPGRVVLHDLVGNQDRDARWLTKVTRVMKYYGRLLIFVARTDARLFHILWFRKFPQVERILVLLYLKLLGKKVVFTAHNIDDRARDGRPSSAIDGFSLRFLYTRADHLFVHTNRMKAELSEAFGVSGNQVTVVPLGINDVVPAADTGRELAREKLGLNVDARVMLFFGTIAPYKGVDDVIRALSQLVREDDRFILAIVGSVRDPSCHVYWQDLERLIVDLGMTDHVRTEIRWIPDGEAGLYFKAADVSVLPYRRVYQSGVLGLSYAHGLPVIAADVADLAAKIRRYFASDLFKGLERGASRISAHGVKRFSWTENAALTSAVYESLMR